MPKDENGYEIVSEPNVDENGYEIIAKPKMNFAVVNGVPISTDENTTNPDGSIVSNLYKGGERPDSDVFSGQGKLIDTIRNTLTDRAGQGPMPWLQGALGSLQTEPLRMIADALSQPETYAGGLAGLPRRPIPPPAEMPVPIRGLLPEMAGPSSTNSGIRSSADYIAGPSGKYFRPGIATDAEVPPSIAADVAGLNDPKLPPNQFRSNKEIIYNGQGQAIAGQPSVPSAPRVSPSVGQLARAQNRIPPELTGPVRDRLVELSVRYPDLSLEELGNRALGSVQSEALKVKPPTNDTEYNILAEMWELSRGTATAADFSAALRQGKVLWFTRAYWKSFGPMFKSQLYGEKAFELAMQDLRNMDIFKNGMVQESGVRLGELGTNLMKREEMLRSNLAEKLPAQIGRIVRASNRGYTAFLNTERVVHLNNIIKAAQRNGVEINPMNLRMWGDFINDATGAGSLKFGISPGRFTIPFTDTQIGPTIGEKGISFGKHNLPTQASLERYTNGLSKLFFSPRNKASQLRMLNPGTYITLPPQVRKQYLGALLANAGLWMSTLALAKSMGAGVNLNPTNPDFAKIRLGNVRFDVGASYGQLLVAAARLISGEKTSSTTGKSRELGHGFKADTRKDILGDVAANSLHPSARFVYDLLNASDYKPFNVADRTLQTYAPMIMGDLVQLYQEDPSLVPLAALPIAGGVGAQTYDKGQREPVFIPKDMDIQFKGGPLQNVSPF